jgi:PAS domain S-box-containing protein
MIPGIRILLTECSQELIADILRLARSLHLEPTIRAAQNKEDFSDALSAGWDFLVCGPTFDDWRPWAALDLACERSGGTRFCVLSENPSETDRSLLLRRGGTVILEGNSHSIRLEQFEDELRNWRSCREELSPPNSLDLAEYTLSKISDALFWIDSEGKIHYVNDAACALYEVSREDILRLKIYDLDATYGKGRWPEFWNRLKNQRSMISETHLHQKDGTVRVLEILSNFVQYGGREYSVAFARDITRRKEIERGLKTQARLLELASDAVVLWDVDDRVLSWNRAAEDLYGFRAAEAIGSDLTAALFPDRDVYCVAKARVLEGGEWTGEFTQRDRAGKELIVSSRWTLVVDEQSGTISILSINTDITGKKMLERQVIHAQRMESIGTLASGIAHDFNNILTPILLTAQFLRVKVDSPDLLQTVETIETSARRGASLVRQLLTFARGIDGERVPMQLPTVLKEIIKIIREIFPRTISCSLQVAPDLWTIRGDPTQVHQVVLNLCLNARDAMPEGGELILSARNETVRQTVAGSGVIPGPFVRVEVKDTGTGIGEANLHKIFDPFFTTKDKGRGYGLGLSTALGIVKSHEGFIEVTSQLAHGTVFDVFLPALPDAPREPQVRAAAESRAPSGLTVLVVDDEETIRLATEHVLTRQGCAVLVASDGAEAVSVFAREGSRIRLVITDLVMPVMGGSPLVRALRKMNDKIPIVITTGWDEESKVRDLEELGGVVCLRKPYSSEELLACVERLFREETGLKEGN